MLPHRSASNYIPKIASVLTLIREIIERGEQVLVAAAFNEPNDELSRRLTDAGVRHLVLDGRTNQKKRGAAAAQFKLGRDGGIPVALAGCDSMAEGHSFHRCNNVILYAYSWAYDKFKQVLDRVHRMNSPVPVNVWVVLCDGTIDARLESLTEEKGNASDLVLDGWLMDERLEEVSFAELLQVARTAFQGDDATATVDETTLLQEWTGLREGLKTAFLRWTKTTNLEPVKTAQTPVPSIAPIPFTFTFENVAPSSPKKQPQTREKGEISGVLDEPTRPSAPHLNDAWRNRLAQRAARLRALVPA